MPVPQISPRELAALLARPSGERPLLLDVRLPQEHEYVHLAGSLLWPLQELAEHEEELAQLVGKDVVVYCHHGIRSLDGAAILIGYGINARSLSGGIDRYALEVDPSLRRY